MVQTHLIMAKKVLCKECKNCFWLSYNGAGVISVDCLEHEGPDGMIHYEVTECEDFKLPDYDNECWERGGYFKAEMLPALRKQICLGSIYIDDYRNSFGIDPNYLCDFFERYDCWLDENGKEDSSENLIEWYNGDDWEITKDNLIQSPI